MMDFRAAAQVLGKEYEERGYTSRLEHGGKHPRLIFGSGGKERFALLSTTENYDTRDILNIKRQDIERDVIPHLPVPIPKAKEKTVQPSLEIVGEARVHPMKIYIGGIGALLTVSLPPEVVPEDSQNAEILLTPMGNFPTLRFVKEPTKNSAPLTKTNSPKFVAFRFQRSKVPFTYAPKAPAGFKARNTFGRFKGTAFVCNSPFPNELITGDIHKDPEKFTLKDGAEFRDCLNEWLAWAVKAGHEPTITHEKSQISISVSEKVTRSL